MIQDICNCYMYLCAPKEDMNDYEEKLLDKCFDVNYEPLHLAKTVPYEPPFTYIKNTQVN
jgi:hypothetical protein